MQPEYIVHLAGVDLPLRTRYPDAIRYFDPKFYTPVSVGEDDAAQPPSSHAPVSAATADPGGHNPASPVGEDDAAQPPSSHFPVSVIPSAARNPSPASLVGEDDAAQPPSSHSPVSAATADSSGHTPASPVQSLPLEGKVSPVRTPVTDEVTPEFAASTAPLVHIDDRNWADYLAEGMEPCAHTEYSMLTPHFSDALLAFDRVILHGVAIRWRDRAWLICAASGTGKSTQAKHLQTLRPGEFSIICGDRPVLEFRSPCHCEPVTDVTGVAIRPPSPPCEIIVHPSPWNGKENWHGADAAPLAGIILLERGEENALVSLTEREAALPFYPNFIQTAWEPENIKKIAELETRMLQAVPIWKLTTFQVPDSTKLLLEAVFS